MSGRAYARRCHEHWRLHHQPPLQHHSTARPNPSLYQVFGYGHILHEDYKTLRQSSYDIAVAKLSWRSKYPPLRIQPPELVELSQPNQTVTIVGWGCTVGANTSEASTRSLGERFSEEVLAWKLDAIAHFVECLLRFS